MFITTTRPNDALIEQLLQILEEASQILLQEYQNYSAGYEFTIQEKHDDSPVTQADLKENRFLLKHLSEIKHELTILLEESD